METGAEIRLDARFTHLVTWDGGGVLVGDEDFVLLHDELVLDVLRSASEPTSHDRVLDELRGHDAARVSYTLLSLREEGVLVTADSLHPPLGHRFDGLARDLADAWGRRESSAVVLDHSLVGTSGRHARILLTDDYLHPQVADRVSAEHTAGREVRLLRVTDRSAWVGPTLPVVGGACFQCLTTRLCLNAPARSLLYARDAGPEAGTRVTELSRALSMGAFQRLASALDMLDERTDRPGVLRVGSDGGMTEHALPSLPQCHRCGRPAADPPGDRVALRSRAKVPGPSNGFRIVTASQTLRRVSTHVDPLFGIVRKVVAVPVPSLSGVHSYTAAHAQHYGRASPVDIQEEARDHSGGKGSTDLDARVSAICESLERHSAIHRGAEETRRARASELGSEAVPPGRLLRFSDDQYAGRGDWNAEHGDGFQWVAEPYRDELIDWSPVRSLVSGERRWVPSGHVFLGFRGRGRQFCPGDSNGLAGGNCLEEAVLQGLLELVERDAVALWWYNRLQRPRVSIGALEDPWCIEIERQYRSAGRILWALDLTHDLGIPVAAAISAKGGREIVFGFGAHLDRRIAVRRALTEASQMLTSLGPDGTGQASALEAHFPDAVAWWREATLDAEPYLVPSEPRSVDVGVETVAAPGRARRREGKQATEDLPTGTDLLADVIRCVSAVNEADIDVLVHDLTRPDVDFPVVRVIAPGLRHFWRRLGPGRLYEVPTRLGWLPSPLPEHELNPRSIFV